MIAGQYRLTYILRAVSAGIWLGLAGLWHEALFPVGTIILVVCWVIAGIYNKYRTEEDMVKAREEEIKRR